mgnify:FL=1
MRYLALISILFLMGCPSGPMEEVVESNNTSDAFKEEDDLSGINPDEVVVDKVEIQEIEADLDNTEWVNKQDLEFKEDGMVYQKGVDILFSGGIKSLYGNGELQERYLVLNGIKHGPYEKYFENGNLNRKCAYKEGKLHGKFKKWYDSGKHASEGQYLDGQEVGIFTWWYENGFRSQQGGFNLAKEHGVWMYYSEVGRVLEKIVFFAGEELEIEDGY